MAGVLVWGWALLPCLGERVSNWRMFKASDGLAESYSTSVSMSRSGNVWVKHGDAAEISVYDGYRIQTMASPGRDFYRVYESRTGQLWSLYSGGLLLYAGEQWVRHPVAQIQSEIQADPLRQLRQIPLVPADRDRVLFLVSDQLMEYEASSHHALVIKSAAETHLGRFIEMSEARDGGLWVSGSKGLLRLPAPLRHIRQGVSSEEFLVPESLQAESLQKPFEDAGHGITLAASEIGGTGRRMILRFANGQWAAHSADGANIRQAWTGWDGSTWACTANFLLRLDSWAQPTFSRERIWAGQYKDVSADGEEGFWLATTEGLLHYTPYLWRGPIEMEENNTYFHALLEDRQNRVWLASSESLLLLAGGRVKTLKWPDGVEATFGPRDALYELPDGRIAIADGDRAFLLDGQRERFEPLLPATKGTTRLLGQLSGGEILLQAAAEEQPAAGTLNILKFDGRRFEPWLRSPTNWTSGSEAYCATAFANGDVWIGGADQAARVRQGSVEVFGSSQGFVESKAYCFADVGEGRVWCGGLSRILEFNGKRWSVVRSGLDRVNAIIKGPDDRIWVATGDGLFSYGAGSWVEHGVVEGLPSTGISGLIVDHERRLWAASTRGVSVFHPDADLSPPKTLPPSLVNARKPEVRGESGTFYLNAEDKWKQTPGDRLLFSTRLDERPWSAYTNANVESFERLGPGKHRLEVKAMDRNRNEDPDFASLDFSVILPWNKDPRLVASVCSATVLVLFFAGLAVNRHMRLIRSYAEVEEMVAVRTRELEKANEELLQSQKMKALGTLAAGIAHDFNNILSIIKGSAQIIQGNLEDRQKILTRLSRIQAVVEQGSGIVRSIHGLSRVKEKDLAVTDLNRLVEEAVKLLSDRFPAELTIHFQPEPSLPPVKVPKDLIQQMLVNLVLNAAEATEQRGEIQLSTGWVERLAKDLALPPARASRYLSIAIRDEGSGMSPEILPRIFEPFFTTKALSARRGTGLGLSMVYELARQMGYGLEVRSTVGRGSVFTIILPVTTTVEG